MVRLPTTMRRMPLLPRALERFAPTNPGRIAARADPHRRRCADCSWWRSAANRAAGCCRARGSAPDRIRLCPSRHAQIEAGRSLSRAQSCISRSQAEVCQSNPGGGTTVVASFRGLSGRCHLIGASDLAIARRLKVVVRHSCTCRTGACRAEVQGRLRRYATKRWRTRSIHRRPLRKRWPTLLPRTIASCRLIAQRSSFPPRATERGRTANHPTQDD